MHGMHMQEVPHPTKLHEEAMTDMSEDVGFFGGEEDVTS